MSDPQLPHLSGTSGGGEAHRTLETETLLPALQPLAGPGEEPGTEPDQPHASRLPAAAILKAVLLAVIGFASVAALVHLSLRRPLYLHADIRSGKLLLMQQMRNNTLSAAFGSSHVHEGFDPRAFDRALAGTALQTRSENLAVRGGSQTEQRAMALEFVRGMHAPANRGACLVLLELGAGANFTNDHLMHPRAINIYDAATAHFVTTLTGPEMPRTQRWGRIAFAEAAMALHYLNIGMVSNALLPSLGLEQDYRDEISDDRRGLEVIPPTSYSEVALARELSAQPRTGQSRKAVLLPGNTLLIEQLMRAQNLRDVQYVYIVMPIFLNLESYQVYPPSMVVNGQTVPIIDLARPDLYPQLYQAQYWADDAHLNEPGAALASTIIAGQLRAFAAQHPIAACGG